MQLVPIETPELIDLVAEWMGKKENYQWLDFGNGVQIVTPVTLKVMAQRDIHFLRAFTSDGDDAPIGVVGLSNMDRSFKTATAWVVLGNKRYGGQTDKAVSRLLTHGFTVLGLEMVHAWTVETNVPGRRLIERLNFHYVGRLRRCHYIDGRPLDRLLFDLLASEHREIEQTGPGRAAGTNRRDRVGENARGS